MAEPVSPRKGPDQHHNIIWDINKSGVQIPHYVGLSSYSAKQRENTATKPDLDRRFPSGIEPAWSHGPRPVITRGTVVTRGTEVYFSASSYGYECPAFCWSAHQRMPHYVFNYNTSDDEWSTLPECRVHDFGLTVVNGLVTIVGGEVDEVREGRKMSSDPCCGPSRMSDSLYVLQEGGYDYWNEFHFPPMAMARKDPAVICVQQYVIVAGGVSDRVLCNSIEMMNIEIRGGYRIYERGGHRIWNAAGGSA